MTVVIHSWLWPGVRSGHAESGSGVGSPVRCSLAFGQLLQTVQVTWLTVFLDLPGRAHETFERSARDMCPSNANAKVE